MTWNIYIPLYVIYAITGELMKTISTWGSFFSPCLPSILSKQSHEAMKLRSKRNQLRKRKGLLRLRPHNRHLLSPDSIPLILRSKQIIHRCSIIYAIIISNSYYANQSSSALAGVNERIGGVNERGHLGISDSHASSCFLWDGPSVLCPFMCLPKAEENAILRRPS